jgi:hypothetical protein
MIKKPMIKKIEEKGIKYVLLSVVDHDNVIREIVTKKTSLFKDRCVTYSH